MTGPSSSASGNRRWLWDTADELVEASRQPNDSDAGRRRFHEVYDQLLWEVVTSPVDELGPFVEQLTTDSYNTIPAPIMVTACRIVGLEPDASTEQVEWAFTGIAMHCDPVEEANALRGIRARGGLPNDRES